MKKYIWILSLLLLITGVWVATVYACACTLPESTSYWVNLQYRYTETGLRYAWLPYSLSALVSVLGLLFWRNQTILSKVLLIILLILAAMFLLT